MKFRRLILSGTLSLIIILSLPLSVLADSLSPDSTADPSSANTAASAPATDPGPTDATTDTTDSQTPTDPTASSQPGNQQPTGPKVPPGPDSNTYTYNSATGLWENAYYTWSPITHQSQPKTPQSYSYNPATGMWDTTSYVFNPAKGQYVPNVASVSRPPANATVNAPTTLAGLSLSTATAPTPGSQNNQYYDLFYNASISNNLQSNATSGNASVIGNTTAGNALSGNATDVQNLINMLQSYWNIQSAANLLTFTSDINGDVTGDLTISLPSINNTGPDSVNSVSNGPTQNNLTINSNGSGLIDNNLGLNSTSGDATVGGNTSAGNATSGAANAIANVVNVLNTAISAGQSFLGVININGNLNGDILLPPDFINQLIASNVPSTTINTANMQNTNVLADVSSTQNIVNSVSLAAASGNANVSDNTTAGNASSGNAGTNLTIFNITQSGVVGQNSLLVFVNVLGKWVGLIMDAPAGSTAAALCGGSCQTSNLVDNNATINSTSNNTILNNLNLAATSGDANVSGNTLAGNATSGDATASANLLNISGSQFSMSGWFGMLFINVLGSWNGSFGVNTSAGDIISEQAGGMGGGSAGGQSDPAQVFQFIPKNVNNNHNTVASSTPSDQDVGTSSNNQKPAVLSTESNFPPAASGQTQGGKMIWLYPVVAASLAGLILSIESVGSVSDRVRLAMLNRRLSRN